MNDGAVAPNSYSPLLRPGKCSPVLPKLTMLDPVGMWREEEREGEGAREGKGLRGKGREKGREGRGDGRGGRRRVEWSGSGEG